MKNFIDWKGRKIFFQASGKGPAIVFLHGFVESGEVWKSFCRRLKGTYRTVAIDLPGHGLSDNSGAAGSMAEMAEAVHQVLKSLDIANCLMVGHSMGGYVTLAFSEKYPRMLKGLVLINSQAGADSQESRTARERIISLVKKDYHGFIKNFIPDLFDPSNVKKFSREIEHLKIIADMMSKEAIIAAQEGMKNRPDRRLVLAQSKVPVLFILGKNDKRVPMEIVIPQTLLPEHSEMLLLGHVGHMGFIEAQATTFEAVKGFAGRVF